MKVIAVALFLVVVTNVGIGSAQLLDKLNRLDFHYMSNCAKGCNGKPKAAFMGPCFDTPTCKIPRCCGIIAGRDSLFRIVYEAAVPLCNGTFNGNLGGIGLGKAVEGCDNQMLAIDLPLFQLIVPPTLAGYSRTLCDQTICPQVVGETYTLDIPFRFVTTAVTSLGIKAQFVAHVANEKGVTALCWGLWATLVNTDLCESVVGVVKDVVTNPLGFLMNPTKTLEKPLAGLIGRKNTNPFQPPAPCDD